MLHGCEVNDVFCNKLEVLHISDEILLLKSSQQPLAYIGIGSGDMKLYLEGKNKVKTTQRNLARRQ